MNMGADEISPRVFAAYCTGYSADIDVIRETEYPLLKETTYLDHAGTTPYAASLIASFAADLTSNLYGNPHSLSPSSQLSTQRIDDIRLKALKFLNADPEEFDLVFVPNATAGIKLVADGLRDFAEANANGERGFWYGYLIDAHTSLVGVREMAGAGAKCFGSEGEVEKWIDELRQDKENGETRLFAYPAQSNMNGQRFDLGWCGKIRATGSSRLYTLLDAASLVSTSPLDLSSPASAPDFTVLSFYKIFGFPDLGALIVRKDSGHVFEKRKFFGGGTVDMVVAGDAKPWHAKKHSSVHDMLEDGTLPFHNIIALNAAFETHKRLYGSMDNVSSHTRFLAKTLYERMARLKHYNGTKVCRLYTSSKFDNEDLATQGAIVAFNLQNSRGLWVGKSEVERLASVKNIQLRSGTLCNPGGTAASLGWTGTDMRRHYSAGMRCGDDHDIMDERPTGILRVSLGAMSSRKDIDTFMAFLEEFYVDKPPQGISIHLPLATSTPLQQPNFYVESLSVYPIKSCGAFKVPDRQRWEVKRTGLAWDREWCLVHQGTGVTLNQKRYPRMALIRPVLDLAKGVLRVSFGDIHASSMEGKALEVSLSRASTNALTTSLCQNTAKPSTVCGDRVVLQAYTSSAVASFFTTFLGVPCTLARFPPQNSTRSYSRINSRGRTQGYSPAKLSRTMPGSFPPPFVSPASTPTTLKPKDNYRNPILLSNESPLLLISRSSVNRLNEAIKASPTTNANSTPTYTPTAAKKAVAADVFRANIVIAETPTIQQSPLPSSPSPSPSPSQYFSPLSSQPTTTPERPYIEDTWSTLHIGTGSTQMTFDVLGPCERCQMVCVDQYTGVRGEEPYATLVKTRKGVGGGRGVFFGRHVAPSSLTRGEDVDAAADAVLGTVMVGDLILPGGDELNNSLGGDEA
ncbi:pyridoxal phosphate-dependent transferase [Aspergillus karnatakaensis]|uniref:putative molybdenum cofactor sulfurase protein (HxB) n=1 Tax=Aspergillus karnatakaensis TaxID=1810916 RepID=UPI003CCC93ED